MTNEQCEQIRIAAAAWEDGETTAITREQIDAHVCECTACRDLIASLADLHSLFAGAERITDDYDVWTAVCEELGPAPSSVNQTRKILYVIGFGASALVFLLAIFFIQQFWKEAPVEAVQVDPFSTDSSTESPASIPKGTRPAGNHPSADESPRDPSLTSEEEKVVTAAIAPHLWETAESESGAPAPFSDESRADEFAIGVVEKVVKRGDFRFLPLKLNKTFKGRLPAGKFFAKDKMVVRIECSLPPKNLGNRSQLYKPGTNVVVYLLRDKASHWIVTSLVPITPGSEDYWQQRLQTFADVVLAGESDEPEKLFREMLVLQPNGGLESTLYHAIMIHPHPAARPVVRKLWRDRVKQHPVDPEESEMVGSISLIYLMRNLNDGEMVDEILKHALRQQPGTRGNYFSLLRILADYADADSRNRLKSRLESFLSDSPALETLDPVKDLKIWSDVSNAKHAIEYLNTLKSIHPDRKG